MLKNPRLGVVLISLGVFVIFVSFAWRHVVTEEMVWSPEQAVEKTSAAANLHERTHEAAHNEIDKASAEVKAERIAALEAAKARFEDSNRELDHARLVLERVVTWLRWTGVGMALIGLFQYQLIKSAK